ncbi:MAG TPA: hypothetical protein VHN13_01940 [Candidatus Tectomicrobia bacterium]|jgi:hypothetical protein|nr:hypothetical protein [Candidatus Tectomicrobia bacterium]
MATTLQEILERYEHEPASTHAVVAEMPDAHATFRPHERSLSWGQLVHRAALHGQRAIGSPLQADGPPTQGPRP